MFAFEPSSSSVTWPICRCRWRWNNFDGPGNVLDSGQVGTGNGKRNSHTPRPSGTEDIQRDDVDVAGNATRGKRRRVD